jgi:AAA+ ATPase superfamily predicted ATPase
MQFIDRTEEQERLRRQLTSSHSSFIVMYGRRRLGKSTLIKQVLTDNDVYYMAEKNEMAVQIALLQKTISNTYSAFSGINFDSWESLFTTFNKLCREGSTLVLDEFPYLVKSCKPLPSVLQKLIDSKKLKFNLIICGSSQRMMQNMVLNASEPLYGRTNERMILRPINISYWKDAFGLSATQTVEEYSVWGGVPRYWELREDEQNFKTALERLVLDPNGVLYDEPASLFMDEDGNNQLYTSIMTALGNGYHQFSRLANAVGKKTTELSIPLKNLTEMAYIRKEVPFGESEDKTKKTLYQIADPFMEFYYSFIAPNKSLLAIGRCERVKQIIQTQLNDHIGHLWERLCQRAVSGNRLLGHDWQMARRWWGKVLNETGEPEQLEFDVVAESVNKKYILIGECKWNQADYSGRLLAELKRKASLAPFAKESKVVYVLFLRERPLDDEDINILLPDDIIGNV